MPDTPDALKLKVTEALSRDVGRALARLDPADMAKLGVSIGDIVELAGKRVTVGKVMPAHKDQRGQARVQIDGVTRENAGVGLDQVVEVRKAPYRPATSLTLQPLAAGLTDRDVKFLAGKVDGLPLVAGDRVSVNLFGSRPVDLRVAATAPTGPVVIDPATKLTLAKQDKGQAAEQRATSYEDIGGLRRELGRIREIIELPLRFPEVFERLGIDPPKGVLLYGPPGCGKTQIARAVARETEAKFFVINGPEIMDKMYGASEANLRQVFEEARKKPPAIIFIDEIDSIAPRREDMGGERQIERRVVAQLLTLMDGMDRRAQVMVIAATNLPNSIDPALRRPGRFDREIQIPIPDRLGRREILDVHSRGMPLAADVDMDHLAAVTHGFVGADLASLCREAAMTTVRRLLPEIDLASAHIPYESLARLEVGMDDFRQALRDVEPSALREVFVEVPDVKWDQIGGLTDVKRRLVEAVEWPLKHVELYRKVKVRPPKGVLLSGPPGCGKTLLAKAAASQSEANFISIKGPALLSRYVGDSEKGVREVFKKARQAAPCIVFFDEIDALVPSRGGSNDGGVTDRVIGQFLAEMDGVEELGGVLILAATNRPDVIDPALLRPGRFDLHLEITPPDHAGRRDIFEINLKNRPRAEPMPYDEFADRTDGYSGAEIEAVCTTAALEAIRDAVTAGAEVALTREHVERGLHRVRPPLAAL